MSEWKLDIVRAFAEAIFPSVREDADLARKAGKEGLARLMEIDGASMDFVTAAVSSKIHPSSHRPRLDHHVGDSLRQLMAVYYTLASGGLAHLCYLCGIIHVCALKRWLF